MPFRQNSQIGAGEQGHEAKQGIGRQEPVAPGWWLVGQEVNEWVLSCQCCKRAVGLPA